MAPNLLTATPSWVNSLTDSTIKADITADIKSGSITFGELEQLFEAVAAESTVIASGLSSSQFSDLQTVVSNLTALGASSYVDYIATSLVDGNVENYIYTGGISGYGNSLGNLAAGSAASVLTLLTDKWFVGVDLASTTYTADGITGTVTYQDQSSLPLYSAGGPSISDINQGPLQDSFLLAGLAELVHQDPAAITQMIHSNGDGTYGVRFFLNGQAIWMTVNSSIAMSTVAGFTNSPALNDAYATESSLWVNLVEKAYAELNSSYVATGGNYTGNNYTVLANGGVPYVLGQLTGAALLTYLTYNGNSATPWALSTTDGESPSPALAFVKDDTNESAIQVIAAALAAKDDVIFASFTATTDASNGLNDLVPSQDYSVIGYNIAANTVTLRNPWGTNAPAYAAQQNWNTTFTVSLAQLELSGGASASDYFYIDNAGTAGVPGKQTISITAQSTTLSGAISSYALASLFSATDSNGRPAAYLAYTISYTGTGGVLDYLGTPQAEGSSVSYGYSALPYLSYIPGLYGGVDTFSLTVTDGTVTSAAKTFTVTTPRTQGALVTPVNGGSITASRNQTFSTAGLFTSSDSTSGATISEYEFDVVARAGASGSFSLNGAAETSLVFFASTSQLSNLSYTAVAGTETIYVRASDGTGTGAQANWGAWAAITVTAPAEVAPVLAATMQYVSYTSTVTAASLVSISSELNAPTEYQFYDGAQNTGTDPVGSLYNGSSASGNITVTASNLSQVTFVPKGSGHLGTSTIYVRVNDGVAWSNWVADTITVANPLVAPVSTKITATRGQSFTAADLFSSSDATSGATISEYEFDVVAHAGASGSFSLSGATETSSLFFASAAQVGSFGYTAVAGTETIYVRASDGTGTGAQANWGAWATITVTAPAEIPPVLAATTQYVSYVSTVTAASLVSISSDLNAPTEYQFYDGAQYAGGDLIGALYNGSSASGYITVTASNLSQVTFVPKGSGHLGTSTIYVRANDGVAWSNWVADTITVANPLVAPVSAAVTATRGQSFTASQLFSSSDATSGATISEYEFDVVARAGASGSSTLNGATESSSVFFATTAQVASFGYTAVAGTETIYVRASDGTGTGAQANWGAWAAIRVTAPAEVAPVLTKITQSVAYTATVTGSSLVSIVSSQATPTEYQFWDGAQISGTDPVGSLYNGSSASGNITVTASNLSQVTFVPKGSGHLGTSTIYVRINDGVAWSNWVADTVTVTGTGTGVAPSSSVSKALPTPDLLLTSVASPLTIAAVSAVSPASLFTGSSHSPSPLLAIPHF